MKTCTGCKQQKELSQFHKRTSAADGRSSCCKVCTKARNAADYKNTKVFRNVASHAYHQEHKDQIRAQKRIYNREHMAAAVTRTKKWRQKNKARVVLYTENRRARKLSAPGVATLEQVIRLRQEQGKKCAYCPKVLDECSVLDHKTPLSRGGTNYIENLQWTCKSCNSRKHTKTHDEYTKHLELRAING